MKDQKVFQMQNLDSKDYEKTEKGAKVAKAGIATVAAGAATAATGFFVKKVVPVIIKGIGSILKR